MKKAKGKKEKIRHGRLKKGAVSPLPQPHVHPGWVAIATREPERRREAIALAVR